MYETGIVLHPVSHGEAGYCPVPDPREAQLDGSELSSSRDHLAFAAPSSRPAMRDGGFPTI